MKWVRCRGSSIHKIGQCRRCIQIYIVCIHIICVGLGGSGPSTFPPPVPGDFLVSRQQIRKKNFSIVIRSCCWGGGGSFDFLFSQDGYIVRSVYVNTWHSCCHRLLYSKSSNFFSHHPLRCGQKKEKSPVSCLNVQQCAFPVAPDSWPLLSLCLFFFFILIYPICCIVIILFLVQSGEQNCSAAENPDLLLLRPVYSLLLLLPLPLVHLLIDHGKTLKLQITHNIMKGKLKMCFYSSSFRSSSLRICVRIYRRRETKSKFSGRTSTIKRKKLKKKKLQNWYSIFTEKKEEKKKCLFIWYF